MTHTIILMIDETPAPKGSVKYIGKGKSIDMQARHHKHFAKTLTKAWESHPNYNPQLAEYDQPVSVFIEIQIKQPDTDAFKKLKKHAPHLVPMPAAKGTRENNGGDLDKLARAVLDALTGKLFKDDSQVCHLEVYKSYEYNHLGTKITIHYPDGYITAKNYTLKQLQQAQQAMKEIVK